MTTRFQQLSREPLVKEASKKFSQDLSVTLTGLERELSPKLGYKADRKVLKKVFESWGVTRSKEDIEKARVQSVNDAKQELMEENLKEKLIILDKKYGSRETLVKMLVKGETTMEQVQRETGVLPYYQSALLKSKGITLPSHLTYNRGTVLKDLEKEGWGVKRLKRRYTVDNISKRELLAEINLSYPLSARMLDRILEELEIRKTPEQIKHHQGSKQRKIEKKIDEKIMGTGYSFKELATLYDKDYSHSYGTITALINEKLPKGEKIVEQNIIKRLSPLVTRKSRSLVEDQFGAVLNKNFKKVSRRNYGIIPPKEIDFIIEDKVAIEFNGDYWHSDRFILENHGITAYEYHMDKYVEAQKAGYSLLFVWESDWQRDPDAIIESIRKVVDGNSVSKVLQQFSKGNNLISELSPLLSVKPTPYDKDIYHAGKVFIREVVQGESAMKYAREATRKDQTLIQLYPWDDLPKISRKINFLNSDTVVKVSARKLELKEIDKQELDQFMGDYHYQGTRRGAVHCYGLFEGKELVSAASFGKAFGKWEFQRYAVKDNYIVHGGAGRLFKKFLEEVEPVSVVSYLDYSHTTRMGNFLTSLGFVEGRSRGTTNWWRGKDRKLVRGSSLVRLGADRLLGTNYGSIKESGLDNVGIMIEEDFQSYKTAGNRFFLWKC